MTLSLPHHGLVCLACFVGLSLGWFEKSARLVHLPASRVARDAASGVGGQSQSGVASRRPPGYGRQALTLATRIPKHRQCVECGGNRSEAEIVGHFLLPNSAYNGGTNAARLSSPNTTPFWLAGNRLARGKPENLAQALPLECATGILPVS